MDEGRPSPAEPTGEIVRRLLADLTALLRLYGRAIDTHARGMARDVGVAAAMVGAAAVLGLFAIGLGLASLVLIVSLWVPAWAAVLLVLVVVAATMAALVLVGVRRVRRRRAAWAARVEEEIRWLRSLFLKEN